MGVIERFSRSFDTPWKRLALLLSRAAALNYLIAIR